MCFSCNIHFPLLMTHVSTAICQGHLPTHLWSWLERAFSASWRKNLVVLQDLKPPLAQESPRTAPLVPTVGTQEREFPSAHFRTPVGDSREKPSIVLRFKETLWKDFYMTEVPSRDVPVSLLSALMSQHGRPEAPKDIYIQIPRTWEG